MKEPVNVVNLSLTQRTIIQLKRFISTGFSSRYECYAIVFFLMPTQTMKILSTSDFYFGLKDTRDEYFFYSFLSCLSSSNFHQNFSSDEQYHKYYFYILL